MKAKKQEVIFLDVYRDAEGRPTFESTRIETVSTKNETGEETGEKVNNLVQNERFTNQLGQPLRKPMNRRSKRYLAKLNKQQ